MESVEKQQRVRTAGPSRQVAVTATVVAGEEKYATAAADNERWRRRRMVVNGRVGGGDHTRSPCPPRPRRPSSWIHAMTSPAVRHINHDRPPPPDRAPVAISAWYMCVCVCVMLGGRGKSEGGNVRKNYSWDNVFEKK